MARTALARGKNKSNFIGYALVGVIMILIGIVMGIQGSDVSSKIAVYAEEEQALDVLISNEEARADEIEELSKYVQTKAYAQEQAQEKLGLVKEGEIIFKRQ